MEQSTALKRIQTMVKANASKLRLLLLFFLFFAIFGALAAPIAAQDEENGITLDLTVGYDSYFKREHWIPVQVTAANSGPAVEGYVQIRVPQGGGLEPSVYRTPLSLPTQSNKRVVLYIKLPAGVNVDLSLHQADGSLVAEVDKHDVWGTAVIALVMVGNDAARLHSQLQKAISWLETHRPDVPIADYEIEILA